MSIKQSADDYWQLSAKAIYTPPKLSQITLAKQFFMQVATAPITLDNTIDLDNIIDFNNYY